MYIIYIVQETRWAGIKYNSVRDRFQYDDLFVEWISDLQCKQQCSSTFTLNNIYRNISQEY